MIQKVKVPANRFVVLGIRCEGVAGAFVLKRALALSEANSFKLFRIVAFREGRSDVRLDLFFCRHQRLRQLRAQKKLRAYA